MGCERDADAEGEDSEGVVEVGGHFEARESHMGGGRWCLTGLGCGSHEGLDEMQGHAFGDEVEIRKLRELHLKPANLELLSSIINISNHNK